jgi:MFS transporter, putative metabolite:H+ symporter
VTLDRYQRRLVVMLSVASFFEGYDFFALAAILPNLRAAFGLDKAQAGWLVGAVNFGTIIAALLVREADKWGRKKLLAVTVAGYTLASLATAASPNAVVFGALQLVARVFLIGEWAVAMVFAAEEYPAERRGMVIGVIQAMSSLGSIVCAGVVPFLLKTPLGWRSVYLVGAVPLLIVAYARRGIRETKRFAERTAAGGPADGRLPIGRVFATPYRGRVLQLALIWALTYIGTTPAVLFWKDFVVSERGFSDAQVGLSQAIAAVASMPFVFLAGKLLDAIGRRRGAALIFVTAAVGVFFSYVLHARLGLTLALVVGIFGASSVLPVLNAYTTELFPTDLRGDAFAWANNLLGRVGYVLSPIALGWLAQGAGWGPVLAGTAVAPLLALGLILALLPETRGRELEETSAAP